MHKWPVWKSCIPTESRSSCLVFVFINCYVHIFEIISDPIVLRRFTFLKLTIHKFKWRINTSFDHFEDRLVHVNEATKKYPKIKWVEKASKSTLFVPQNIFETVFGVFFEGCELVGDIVFLQTELTSSGSFNLQPFNQTRFMHISHTSFTFTDLF